MYSNNPQQNKSIKVCSAVSRKKEEDDSVHKPSAESGVAPLALTLTGTNDSNRSNIDVAANTTTETNERNASTPEHQDNNGEQEHLPGTPEKQDDVEQQNLPAATVEQTRRPGYHGKYYSRGGPAVKQ